MLQKIHLPKTNLFFITTAEVKTINFQMFVAPEQKVIDNKTLNYHHISLIFLILYLSLNKKATAEL